MDRLEIFLKSFIGGLVVVYGMHALSYTLQILIHRKYIKILKQSKVIPPHGSVIRNYLSNFTGLNSYYKPLLLI